MGSSTGRGEYPHFRLFSPVEFHYTIAPNVSYDFSTPFPSNTFDEISFRILNDAIAEAYLNISAQNPTPKQIRRCEELLRGAVELSENLLSPADA